jgi:tripartite-type tricarboxylate transporter receptor subunit TctC
VKDFAPIVLYGNVPNILMVNLTIPVKTLAEVANYVKANREKLNYGSTGNGSSMPK